MNLTLKAIYVCVAATGYWGKGYTIAEAMQNAKIKTKAAEKTTKFYVQAALFDNPNEEELKNLHDCISISHGVPQYYQVDRTEEDTKQIKEKHVGWLTVIDKWL